jgi:hypothetical protein
MRMTRVDWKRVAQAMVACAALLVGGGTGSTAVAFAAPLTETEPNEDVLTANGPIPPDGWVATKNTTNDVDVAFIRLAGRQQVTFSVQALGANCLTDATVVDEDGETQFRTSFGAGTSPETKTWTTPRDAAQYTVRMGYGTGCQGLFKVSPASAVINGPLPPLDYGRTLTVSAPTTAVEGQSVSFGVSGVAAYKDQLAVAVQAGGCSSRPPTSTTSSRDDDPLGVEMPGGAFSSPGAGTAPGDGPASACAWLVDGLGKLPVIVGQQSFFVATPPASIKLKAASRTRQGSTFKVTATATGGTGRRAIVDLNKPGVPCGADARTNARFARVLDAPVSSTEPGSAASDKTTPGAYTLCGYVQESDIDPEPAEAVTSRVVQVGTPPGCRVATASVRRGRLLPISCTGIPSADTVKIAIRRRGKSVRVSTSRVRGGRAYARAPRTRGTYVVTVSLRGAVIARREVKVR